MIKRYITEHANREIERIKIENGNLICGHCNKIICKRKI